ncbi:MAG: type II toxin-antitoxin system VapC family toxin [Thermodesulfobacteriota bacterium]
MKAFVVDASVALKWYLPDKEGVEQALLLLDAFMREEITLHAPSLIDWEFVNAMWVAGRTGRIAPEDRDAAVQNFLGLDVSRTRCNDLSVSILSVATELGRSCYDSAYLALSGTTGARFVTGDKRLFNATKKRMQSVIWIEHLQVVPFV